jgi:hypothetical protein
MSWFQWFRFRPTQRINTTDSQITNSEIQVTQAGRDAYGFQDVERVTIVNETIVNETYISIFGAQHRAAGVDWEWSQQVIKEQRAEVINRLKYVLLRDRFLMPVKLLEQPERVNRSPLESERRLIIAGKNSELLDPGRLMIEVFGRSDIAGKLLILGKPGAGKTTVLLSLTEQLLIGAMNNPKTVIPVVFELSTWKNDHQSIHDWLIEQLYDLHGGDKKQKRYEQWLEQRVLLPLLDGLDELGMERQKKCMAKLNDFTKQYPQVVVCCRSQQFEESEIRLRNLRGAVELEPLTDHQIQAYLEQVQREELWTQIQDTPEMRRMLELHEDEEAGLLRVPLFVSIAAAIYDVNQPFRTKGELLERYIDGQLSFDVRSSDRRKELEGRKWTYTVVEKEPTARIVWHYLSWSARQLNRNNEVNFLIEKMQPSWLENPRHKRLYQLIVGLIIGLIIQSILTPIFISVVTLKTGITIAFIASVFVGSVIGLTDIQPVESFQVLKWSATSQKFICEFRSGLIVCSISGLIIGLIGGKISGVSSELVVSMTTGLIIGLISGLIMGLISGLIVGLKQDLDLKVRSRPNQGTWNSLLNLCFSSVIAIPLGILCMAFLRLISTIKVGTSLETWLSIFLQSLSNSIIPGCFMAIAIVFGNSGGRAFVQHFCLRFVLAYSGTFPFFCVPFLNYCTERRLVQRIGGRYRFIHRELLEHFAKRVVL